MSFIHSSHSFTLVIHSHHHSLSCLEYSNTYLVMSVHNSCLTLVFLNEQSSLHTCIWNFYLSQRRLSSTSTVHIQHWVIGPSVENWKNGIKYFEILMVGWRHCVGEMWWWEEEGLGERGGGGWDEGEGGSVWYPEEDCSCGREESRIASTSVILSRPLWHHHGMTFCTLGYIILPITTN